jgi:hypothetical protein
MGCFLAEGSFRLFLPLRINDVAASLYVRDNDVTVGALNHDPETRRVHPRLGAGVRVRAHARPKEKVLTDVPLVTKPPAPLDADPFHPAILVERL